MSKKQEAKSPLTNKEIVAAATKHDEEKKEKAEKLYEELKGINTPEAKKYRYVVQGMINELDAKIKTTEAQERVSLKYARGEEKETKAVRGHQIKIAAKQIKAIEKIAKTQAKELKKTKVNGVKVSNFYDSLQAKVTRALRADKVDIDRLLASEKGLAR